MTEKGSDSDEALLKAVGDRAFRKAGKGHTIGSYIRSYVRPTHPLSLCLSLSLSFLSHHLTAQRVKLFSSIARVR